MTIIDFLQYSAVFFLGFSIGKVHGRITAQHSEAE